MKYRLLRSLIATLLGLSILSVQARPASWHRWFSKIDGSTVCLQTSPGAGWSYGGGPFRDARCSIPDRRF